MTARVVADEFPRRRNVDVRIEHIANLFQKAEAHLKKAEQQCYALCIPSLNELRYAGHHLLNAMTAVDGTDIEYELHEAESHCNRAIFDAVEIRLLDHLQRIEQTENDYKSIEISKIIDGYFNLRGHYLAAKQTLSSITRNRREDHLSECETHILNIEAYSAALDRAKPELQKAIVKDRFNTRITMLLVFIGFLTLAAAIFGDFIPFMHKDTAAQSDKSSLSAHPKKISPN